MSTLHSVHPSDTRVERDRGREADRPQEIPAKGWWDILWRVKGQLAEDNMSLIAAGVAFYALLAIFPSLAAAVSIYGLFASPQQIATQLQSFAGMVPEEGMQILQEQLHKLAAVHDEALGIGALVGIVVALWSARKGMSSLIAAVNVAYHERDERGFIRSVLVSMAFTVGAVLGLLAVVLFGIAVPVVVKFLPIGQAAEWLLLALRWVLLWCVAALGLAVVYRFAPYRNRPQWQWLSPGSVIAATLWLLGSLLFALYVRNFGTFGAAYGTIGGVVIMLMWFYISAQVILLGAEINSEMERQTVKDTTEGPPQPLGKRGAYAADTLGPRR